MIHCLTTMHKPYYDGIGKIMIKTWLDCFPNNYRLHLYLEDFTIDNIDNRIIVEDWNEVKSLFEQWRRKNIGINVQQEKFTKKALSQIAFWRKYSGKMLWLDADTFSIKPIPDTFFDDIIEHYPLASWGQEQFESGTVWIDLDHQDFNPIKQIYESIYLGNMGLPKGQRWFDGELLGWACTEAGSKHLNLRKHCTAKTSTPLNRSWIGEYIRHLKAKQKKFVKETLINEFKRYDLAALLEGQL